MVGTDWSREAGLSSLVSRRCSSSFVTLFPWSEPSGPHFRSTVKTVRWEVLRRAGAVHSYTIIRLLYPATAGGCCVGASSSRVTFCAILVEFICSVLAGLTLDSLVNDWGWGRKEGKWKCTKRPWNETLSRMTPLFKDWGIMSQVSVSNCYSRSWTDLVFLAAFGCLPRLLVLDV